MEANFARLIETNARRLGDKTVLVWDDGRLSWAELDRRASGFALHLSRRAVGPGDRVAIILPNNWSFVVGFLAVLKLGATAAPFSPDLKKDELDDLLADLRPKHVITRVPVETGSCSAPEHAQSPAVIIYTSGSTGRPKGAVFSHRALVFGVRLWGDAVMGLQPDDVVLGVLPYSHNYGLWAGLLAPLLFDATAALLERFTPEKVLDSIKKYRVTVFPGVATMFRRVLSSPAFASADLTSLRAATSGAAPCPAELCLEWEQNTRVKILCGYGATEVPRTLSYSVRDTGDVPTAAGRIMPGVEIKIVDDRGVPVPDGEVGELLIKSPSAMDGYLDRPEETKEVLADGWFSSGDLGMLLPGGFIRLAGRKRERILRGGYSVFPPEVETVLMSHPAVAEAAVVGVPHPDLGEEVAAFVALKPRWETAAEDITEYCKAHLAHYKYPRRVTIIPELPRGLTGKVLKTELVKRYGAD
jgi:long-chain acyl-CoA synthetase